MTLKLRPEDMLELEQQIHQDLKDIVYDVVGMHPEAFQSLDEFLAQARCYYTRELEAVKYLFYCVGVEQDFESALTNATYDVIYEQLEAGDNGSSFAQWVFDLQPTTWPGLQVRHDSPSQ